MERRRNFLPLAGFLVCALVLPSYAVFFARFPVTRDVPWASWLLCALGLGLLGIGLLRPVREPEKYRGRWLGRAFAVLGLASVAFFLYLTLVQTREMPAAAGAPKVGQKAPDFVLPDTAGRPVRLYDLLGPQAGGAGKASWVLLIFYRGYW